MSFHTMVDLETFATSNNAYIISIGACNFNKEGLCGEFYANIHTAYKEADFDISPETVMWWMSQSTEAKTALKADPMKLSNALRLFGEFIEGTDGVWGNGSTFDNVILRNAYNKLNMKCPWHFRKDKCFRTVANLYPREDLIPEGTQHNAIDDAKNQARVIIMLANKHGFKL